jgi:hypothetical protein
MNKTARCGYPHLAKKVFLTKWKDYRHAPSRHTTNADCFNPDSSDGVPADA